MFFRTVFYGIVAAMLAAGGTLAAADKSVPARKVDKKSASTPATVTPQGSVSFGEAVSPANQHRARLTWPEMTQKEIDDLTSTLKAVAKTRGAPVMIVCLNPMCEDLALNLDNAFESARWKSVIVIGTPFGVGDGIAVSSAWLADLLNAATGNRYGAKVGDVKDAGGGETILIGARPR